MCLGKLRMINSQTKPIQLLDFKDEDAILKASRHNSHNTYKSMQILLASGYSRAICKARQEWSIIFR